MLWSSHFHLHYSTITEDMHLSRQQVSSITAYLKYQLTPTVMRSIAQTGKSEIYTQKKAGEVKTHWLMYAGTYKGIPTMPATPFNPEK